MTLSTQGLYLGFGFYLPSQLASTILSVAIIGLVYHLQGRSDGSRQLTRMHFLAGLGLFFLLNFIALPAALGRCPGAGETKPPQAITDPLGVTVFAAGLLAGLLTFLSPCGLPVFPAYVSFYLGGKPSALRSLTGGFSAAGGMAVAFTGLIISTYSIANLLFGYADILELVGGLMALLMGILMIFEFQLLRFPSKMRAPERRGHFGLFFFGAAWGFAEVVCTPYLFISILVFAISAGLRGTLSFIGFGIGMTLPVVMLTIFVVKGRRGAVTRLLRYVPALQKISSLVLLFLGVILLSLSLLYFGVI